MLLLDTASLYFRAFFGVPDSLRAPDGTPVNAVRGLVDFIARLATEYTPTHLVCCWDNNWRPSWRVAALPSYKAHRVVAENPGGVDAEEMPEALAAQIPIIREVLAAAGIAVAGVDDYEADDVIGTLTAKAPGPVNIATGDRDLFQLVDDDREVRVLYTARGVSKHEVVTGDVIEEKYGITPAQYADFAILRGDPSDGLAGVKGIGDKTAAKLVTEYGDLEGIIAAASDDGSSLTPSQRRNITAAADYLAAAPTVVRVATDLPVGDDLDALKFPYEFADPQRVAELAQRWGLGGSIERLQRALSARTSQ